MAYDFPFERRLNFGEWLNQTLHETVTFEDAAWAIDRVRRVEARLQAARAPAERLTVEIPWMDEMMAFTAPGRYIYFARRLYQVCYTDEQVAFVIGHEMAHHDLGHVALFRGWAGAVARLPGVWLFAVFFQALERLLYGPDKESQADRHGLDLCLAAGYCGARCLELIDIMERMALDTNDDEGVYGSDVESDHKLDENATWLTKAQIWAWQRKRGYLSIHDRRQMLRKHLASKGESPKRTEPGGAAKANPPSS